MNARVLELNAKDNVLVALSDLRQGEEIAFAGRTYKLKTDVPAKHKFATEEIGRDGAVVMYGEGTAFAFRLPDCGIGAGR